MFKKESEAPDARKKSLQYCNSLAGLVSSKTFRAIKIIGFESKV
jgi:hypothetical protein